MACPAGRQFPAARLNQKWYGDGTEILTDEGKLYLASVMDAASRRILGFTLSRHHDAAAAYGGAGHGHHRTRRHSAWRDHAHRPGQRKSPRFVLRLTGPVLLGLALLALRGRVKR
jgi:Integrase core domain